MKRQAAGTASQYQAMGKQQWYQRAESKIEVAHTMPHVHFRRNVEIQRCIQQLSTATMRPSVPHVTRTNFVARKGCSSLGFRC